MGAVIERHHLGLGDGHGAGTAATTKRDTRERRIAGAGAGHRHARDDTLSEHGGRRGAGASSAGEHDCGSGGVAVATGRYFHRGDHERDRRVAGGVARLGKGFSHADGLGAPIAGGGGDNASRVGGRRADDVAEIIARHTGRKRRSNRRAHKHDHDPRGLGGSGQ